jgi:hypothetical protein
MIFGLALIMAALAILGHDCQVWFERGAWASTTIDGTLEMVRLNDDLMDRFATSSSFTRYWNCRSIGCRSALDSPPLRSGRFLMKAADRDACWVNIRRLAPTRRALMARFKPLAVAVNG